MKAINILISAVVLILSNTTIFAAGDAGAGASAYSMCGACHGLKGEGNRVMNAPKLAGQDDWYIISSLKKFKNGTRGKGDPVAAAMIPMATMLDDKKMEDIAAYIATF
ncbi:MAG: c-type cytochrome [Gammaproteobacteria bacterium]|nr:c-type cytochrome [Gammaproteobacteria bacterium]